MLDANSKINGVIFDFDGTLVRSTIDYLEMRRSMLEVISDYDLPDGIIDPKESSANNIIAAWKYLSARSSEQLVLEFEGRVETASCEIELSNASATVEVEGASRALESLRSRGFRTGILTRGSRRYVEKALEVSRIPFDRTTMVCRDDHRLMEAKPNPIALVRAAARLGLRTEECVYVGDHVMDHQCARSAHMPFIGVLSGYNDIGRWKGVDGITVIDSIASLPDILDGHNRS